MISSIKKCLKWIDLAFIMDMMRILWIKFCIRKLLKLLSVKLFLLVKMNSKKIHSFTNICELGEKVESVLIKACYNIVFGSNNNLLRKHNNLKKFINHISLVFVFLKLFLVISFIKEELENLKIYYSEYFINKIDYNYAKLLQTHNHNFYLGNSQKSQDACQDYAEATVAVCVLLKIVGKFL